MTAILLADCDVHWNPAGDSCKIVTPTTADSGDTVDITALLQGRKVTRTYGWDTDSAGGDEATATYVIATDVITIDTGGATTDHQYVVTVDFLHI